MDNRRPQSPPGNIGDMIFCVLSIWANRDQLPIRQTKRPPEPASEPLELAPAAPSPAPSRSKVTVSSSTKISAAIVTVSFGPLKPSRGFRTKLAGAKSHHPWDRFFELAREEGGEEATSETDLPSRRRRFRGARLRSEPAGRDWPRRAAVSQPVTNRSSSHLKRCHESFTIVFDGSLFSRDSLYEANERRPPDEVPLTLSRWRYTEKYPGSA